MTRNARGEYHSESLVSLKLYKFNQWNDWTIFLRCDDQTFSSEDIATIDTNVNGELNYVDTRAQVIQCPVEFGHPSSSRPGDSINAWWCGVCYLSLKVIAMYQAVFYEVGHDDDDKFDISIKRVKRRLMKCSTESEKTENRKPKNKIGV